MKLKKTILSVAILANLVGVGMLSAINTVQAADAASVIESRQARLKKMGGAMKAINEQLKADEADMTKIQEAAQTLVLNASGIAEWFPLGSGAESGEKTDALAAIWQEPDNFAAKAKALGVETATLAKLTKRADMTGLPAQFKAVKSACSNCHKSFRAD